MAEAIPGTCSVWPRPARKWPGRLKAARHYHRDARNRQRARLEFIDRSTSTIGLAFLVRRCGSLRSGIHDDGVSPAVAAEHNAIAARVKELRGRRSSSGFAKNRPHPGAMALSSLDTMYQDGFDAARLTFDTLAF